MSEITARYAATGEAGSVHAAPASSRPEGAAMGILLSISFCHLLNDLMQSLLPAIYPMLAATYALDFGQVGLITMVFQITASLLQPFVGIVTDKRAMPFSLAFGMGLTLLGLLMLSLAGSFALLLVAAALVGMGSSVFHPESSRVARMASGGKHGLAQSVFQVGGNAGTALGPLLAAFVVLRNGQGSIAWFSFVALLGMSVLTWVGLWYRRQQARRPVSRTKPATLDMPRRQVTGAIIVLLLLIFSKYFYLASLTSYFTFYLIDQFALSVRDAQLHLFIFLGAVAAGTIAGGPIGDRIGRKPVIWVSILGILPFTLLLPHVNLFWTTVLTLPIGFLLASAFPAIIVYAQDLLPGKVGTVAGLFFGFAFGMGGLGAAVLGQLADLTSIRTVYQICAFLPLIGLLAAFLPSTRTLKARTA
ncbi:MFS transporter, FSR family, fosmidomycin resistance protein [Arboricoccus pini]|uniref:MFS transporter, FSR family, fosmidomycin resistance protein n=1 Tax=Arboricoccus pini TaxID=1963835 RepID=A0A212RE96_9PROT|nr:MFS transporter [Arboricoccus pini]SNB70482.1 MFS transporter, FSR family, fosmidomycin resistance protein [Arboricoccus pini]